MGKYYLMEKFAVIALLVLLAPVACGNVFYVGEGWDYKKIQPAIDDANFYDTIIVYPGFYTENITINKSIYLEGRDAIISGGIKIFANDINLSGFLINGSYFAIEIKGNRNVIKNCSIIFSNSYGIKIEGKNNMIEGNKIFKNNFGIYLYFFSENNTIRNNEIYRNNCGIYVWKGIGNAFIGNIIRNNLEGIKIEGGENNFLNKNNISENSKGIYLCCNAKDNLIFENNFIGNLMHVYCYADKNIWNLSNGNYWDNLSGDIFFIDEKNIDYSPSKSPYDIENLSSKIYIFYPEENASVSGKIVIQGMVEKEGKVRIRIDDGPWENATGTFLWYYELDTKNLRDGKHEIYVEFEGNVMARTVYFKNKKSIPSFDVALLILVFLFILKNRKKYL
ncbi:MAG: right-handed parallel beta-helix repeat-containing protein [Thermoplasmatales archaeon]|nr:right-handed parallel beta-helix repeat-containing protein [Thermoplasmatales archaeon]